MPSLIGNKPNQVPSNGDLGTLAFQDSNAVNITGGTVDVSAGTAALPTLGTTGDPNTGVFFPAADTIAFSEGGTEIMRIASDGNVGIGTTSPYTKLDVNGSTGLKVYATTGTDLNSVGSIALGDGNRSANYTGLYRGTSISGGAASIALTLGAYDYIGFNVSATTLGSQTERMRINASGNVGLGNTSPATRIDIFGNGGGVTSTVRLGSNTNDSGTIQFFNSTASSVNSTISGNLEGGNAGGDIRFSTKFVSGSLTEKMRLDGSGNLLVGTTSATSGGAKLQTVDGITFPATQVASANANTLDDYEEGTWTPSDGSVAGLSFTVTSATYVKVGRIVHCQFQLTYPTTANTSGARITGLPFTPASGINSNGYLGSTASVGISIQTAGSINTNILNAIGADSTMNSVLSNALVYGTFTYFV